VGYDAEAGAQMTINISDGALEINSDMGDAVGYRATGAGSKIILSFTGASSAYVGLGEGNTGHTAYGYSVSDGGRITVEGETHLNVEANGRDAANWDVDKGLYEAGTYLPGGTAYGYHVDGGTLEVSGSSELSIRGDSGATGYFATGTGAAIRISDESRLSVSSDHGDAYGYYLKPGKGAGASGLEVTGTSSVTVTGGKNAVGYFASGAQATLAVGGTSTVDVRADNGTAIGYEADNGATIEVAGESRLTVIGKTARGLLIQSEGGDPSSMTISGAAITVEGTDAATGIVGNGRGEATISDSYISSSHTGIANQFDAFYLTLTDVTLSNAGGGIAFDVGLDDPDKLPPAALTITADHSFFNGSAVTREGSTFDLTLANGSEWRIPGDSNLTRLTNDNSHIYFSGAGDAPVTLTVENYTTLDGHLWFNTTLNDEKSPTDRLVVTGDTSGTGTIHVTNRGGIGAPTGGNGIELIEVRGNSDAEFVLAGDYVTPSGEQAVVAGAYAYTLVHPDNNWYLHSEAPSAGKSPVGAGSRGSSAGSSSSSTPLYQANAPVSESYARRLVNSTVVVDTFRQRIGGHYGDFRALNMLPIGMMRYLPVSVAADMPVVAPPPETAEPTRAYFWAETAAAHSSLHARNSTTDASTMGNDWELKSGFDAALPGMDDSTLLAGINVFYGIDAMRVKSVHSNGDIDSRRYGVGATLTWFNETTYIDAQAKAVWFDTDLSSDLLGTLVKGNDAFGYALSIEGGHEIKLNSEWAMTPQVQLTYGSVDMDSFRDRYNNLYTVARATSLKGRLGMAVEYHTTSVDARGGTANTRLYAIPNLYYEFRDGTKLNLEGTDLENRDDPLWGGVSFGVSHDWSDGIYRVFVEADPKTSLREFGDSYVVSGRAGMVIKY
ncbi:MAG: autotransporter outer membrane beta-barrel domain-containing protein, partial [Methylobacteriaceae bacterium]|nr:autotransporter outer membrane beta-barrel domain-containing protein [Methylobacteriaceae bacterium]